MCEPEHGGVSPWEATRIAEVAHASEAVAHASHPPVDTTGMGGPIDPEYWMESSRATGGDLDDIMSAVSEERALARVPPPPPGTPELGSALRPFDPMEVPATFGDINYPPRMGAEGQVIDRVLPAGSELSRIGEETGDFLALGDPSMGSRALAPSFRRVGHPLYQESLYETTRGLPVQESTVAPAFAQPGGATQIQTPVSVGDLTADGALDLQRQLTLSEATPLERAEMMMATAHHETDAVLPELRAPSSSDSCTMLDDMELAYANETAALAETLDVRPLARAPDVVPGAAAAEVVAETGDAAAVAATGLHGVTPLAQVLGTVGAAGGLYQTVEGVHELTEGEYEYGAIDTTAGVAGTATGLAATGILGDGAVAATLACPPVAVGAAALGLASAGHHYQADHDTWGEPTVDENGEVHHLTSFDFVEANASRAYDESHDAMYDAVGGGTAGDVVGTTFGAINAGVMGFGAGMIGLGGDLYGGVEATVEAASSLFSWLAD